MARSPLDDLSGFAGLFDEGPAAGGQMPGVSRGAMDQLGDDFRLPPRSQGLDSGIKDSIKPQPGIDLSGEEQPHGATIGIGSSDTVALPGGDGNNPFGVPLGRIDTRRPTSREKFEEEAPFGDKPAEGKKQTFYPMLEFGQDFRGLDDDGAANDPQADSLPPVAARRRVEPAPKPERAPPRTQALDFSAEMTGNAPPVSFDLGMDAPTAARDASKPLGSDDEDAGLLGLAMSRRATGSRPAVSDEDVARMKFDLVGDLARKSQPRTPYDSYVFGSLFLFSVLLSTVVGVAAYRNGGTFDFSDPQRMLAIARGEAAPTGSQVASNSPAMAVVVGDALVENHQAAAVNLFAVSSATVGRLLTESGAQLVLVEGVLTNRTPGTLRDMRMDVALMDDAGVSVVTTSAVIGTEIAAGELAEFADAGALQAAMEQAAGRVADFELQAGQSTRFSAVFFPGETDLTGLIPVIRPLSAASNAHSSFATITLSGELPVEEPTVGTTDGSGDTDGSSGTDGEQGAGELRVPAPEEVVEGSGDAP